MSKGVVPSETLHALVLAEIERGRYTWTEIAIACGFENGKRRTADTTQLKRTLGAMPQYDARYGKVTVRKMVGSEVAAKIVRAIGLDPVDVDGL
jgi:hypothetical protein